MVEIRHILCPTDFSPAADHALEHAIAIARWYDSQITALHVIHVPLFPEPPVFAVAFADPTPSPPVSTGNYQPYLERLHAWLEPARRAGIKTEVRVCEGTAHREILEYAQARQVELIVMGTHGLSGFERFMLGSVTEKVLRKATCPVLTVPPAAENAAKLPYTRLLCPVDFSESSVAALQFAVSLAEEADAKLTILHVLDWPRVDDLLVKRFDPLQFRDAVEEEARTRLEALVTDEIRVWCKPSTKMLYGKPYREILDLAAAEGTDLIVMGVRGRNPLDLTLFGSTTNHVVRRASCPVLTLRQ